jgi:hypothetical protein
MLMNRRSYIVGKEGGMDMTGAKAEARGERRFSVQLGRSTLYAP